MAPTTCFDSPGRHTQWQSPRERYGEAEAEQASEDNAATVLSSRDDDDDDDSGTRPAFLRWLYSTYAYTPAAMPPTRRNMLGIMEIRAEYPNPKDLTKFMGKYRTDGVDAKYTVVQISGGRNDPSHPGREASLDTQYAMAWGIRPHSSTTVSDAGRRERTIISFPYSAICSVYGTSHKRSACRSASKKILRRTAMQSICAAVLVFSACLVSACLGEW